MSTRKENRDRQQLSVTIDSRVKFRLFELAEKFHTTPSRLADKVLTLGMNMFENEQLPGVTKIADSVTPIVEPKKDRGEELAEAYSRKILRDVKGWSTEWG